MCQRFDALFLNTIISDRLSFAASLAVVICTNTGVVEESTEITITFNTLYYFNVVVDAST